MVSDVVIHFLTCATDASASSEREPRDREQGNPLYLSHFVTVFSNLHPIRSGGGGKIAILCMFTELSRCKKLLI